MEISRYSIFRKDTKQYINPGGHWVGDVNFAQTWSDAGHCKTKITQHSKSNDGLFHGAGVGDLIILERIYNQIGIRHHDIEKVIDG